MLILIENICLTNLSSYILPQNLLSLTEFTSHSNYCLPVSSKGIRGLGQDDSGGWMTEDVGDPLGGFGAQGDSLSHEAEIENVTGSIYQ